MKTNALKKTTSLLIALAMLLSAMLALASCGEQDDGAAAALVTIDINPSVELTLDSKGAVLSAYGANEDAQVLLYGEDGIVGKSVDEAVEKITALALELGYIDAEGGVILSSVYADGARAKRSIEEKVAASVERVAQSSGVALTVSAEALYSTVRDLAAIKQANPDSQKIQQLTPEEYRLVISATKCTDLSLEQALELSEEELIERINEAHARVQEFATAAYESVRKQAMLAYEGALSVAMDTAYVEYYATRMLTRPEQFINASLLVAYSGGAVSLSVIELAAEQLEDSADHELDAAEINEALRVFELGEQDVHLISDASGRVTVRSVAAYANKAIKNSIDEDAREALEEKVDGLLDEVEDRVEDLIDEALIAYKPQLDAIMESLSGALGAFDSLPVTALSAVRAELEQILSKYAELIEDGGLSEDDIEEILELYEEKAEHYRGLLEANMTEEERSAINSRRESIRENMAEQMASVEQQLAQAEQQAKAYLQAIKDARKSK